MNALELLGHLRHYRYRAASESELQEGIERVLQSLGPYEREVVLSPRDRIDFMVGNVGIEAKLAGSRTEVLRQLHRYAEHERVAALILVTRRSQLASLGGLALLTKPLYTVNLRSGLR